MLKPPNKFHSRRQWVRWTKMARDHLIANHRFALQDFCRVGNTEPSLSMKVSYPRSFARFSKWHSSFWDIAARLPSSGWVYWPEGVDFAGEAFDPQDPVDILREINAWSTYDYKAEQGEIHD
jgi:hypothetical protein